MEYKNIERLNLTPVGEIKLSAFPQEALTYAMTKLRELKKPVDDVFRYVFTTCKQWCDERNMRPNYREMNDILRQKGLDFAGPSLDTQSPFVMRPKERKGEEIKQESQKTDAIIAKLKEKPEITTEREIEAQQSLKKLADGGNEFARILMGSFPKREV